MDRSEKVILTTMCMVRNKKDGILIQNRKNKDWNGVTFPGGHVEKNESFVESVIREVYEETGLIIQNPKLCGIKQFQTKDDIRYIVYLFESNKYSGKLTSSNEGEVSWIKREDLNNYILASGFEDMVKVFEDDSLSECYYYKDETQGIKLKLL